MNAGFHQAISTLLVAKLKPFQGKSLDRLECQKIYEEVFSTLTELFQASKTPLDNEAANYVAQSYYDGIQVKGSDGSLHELDPNIFSQRASLDNIPTSQLAIMAAMLHETDFKYPILEKIKQRQ